MARSSGGWPWWAKAVIVVVGLAGFGYVRVRGVASDAMQSLNLVGWASFDSTYVDWNGDIGARNVRLWPWEGDPDTDAITAERFVIDTPGWGWVLQSAFSFGSPSKLLKGRAGKLARAAERMGEEEQASPYEDIPAMPRVHARFENVVFSEYAHQYALSDYVVGLSSGSLFESEGCGQDAFWAESELVGLMDLRSDGVNFELDLNATGSETISLRLALEAPGRSSWTYESTWQAPHEGNMVLVDWEQARLRNERWTVKDDGFVAARNAYCAEREKLDEAQFVEQHIDFVQRRLLAWGLFAGQPLIERYRRFASEGGHTLTWEANPTDPVSLEKLYGFSGSDMLWMLNSNLRVDDERGVPFKLHFVEAVPYDEEGNIESAARMRELVAQTQAGLPAEAVAEADSAAAAANAPKPNPKIQTMVVSAETTMIGVDGQMPTAENPVLEDVSYDDLAYMVGERVIIRTTMRSTREGELKSFNRAGLRIALRDRPDMELEVPKDTVKSVRVVWTKAQTAAAAAAAGQR